MLLATSEQLAIFRSRRLRSLLVELGTSLFAPVPAVAVLLALGEGSIAAKVASAITFLAVALSGQIARRLCFHCPACNGPLPRGPQHVPFGQVAFSVCSQCQTRFRIRGSSA